MSGGGGGGVHSCIVWVSMFVNKNEERGAFWAQKEESRNPRLGLGPTIWRKGVLNVYFSPVGDKCLECCKSFIC